MHDDILIYTIEWGDYRSHPYSAFDDNRQYSIGVAGSKTKDEITIKLWDCCSEDHKNQATYTTF
jgi:hypothetical protein